MSKVETVKGEGIKAYFRILFGFDNQINISNLDSTVEDIQPSENISEADIEELKKSTKRIQSLTEKYRIEKFEASAKKEKADVTKKAVQKEQKSKEKQIQDKTVEKDIDEREM